MKNLCKAALLLILPFAVSCSKTEGLEITNNYSEGFYVMALETAEKSTPEEIEKLYDDGKIQHIDKGGVFMYQASAFNSSDSELDQYEKNGRYAFCFVADSGLEKAKKEKKKVEYDKVSQDFEMNNITAISIIINDNNGEPNFELTLKSKTEF
jgi:hypothetical protein